MNGRSRGLRAASALLVTALLAACVSAGGGVAASPGAGAPAPAADGPPAWAVYTGAGEASTMEALVAAMGAVEVVWIGEEHDDSVGHALKVELLGRAHARYGAAGGPSPHEPSGDAPPSQPRPMVLSLEMFERDVQGVVDEYLAGLITEDHFLAASRPWERYESDYRALMEFARAHGMPVVAANAPRRYVNMVSRMGLQALEALSHEALATLPPLPIPEPSARYRAQWDSIMGGAAAHGAMPPGMLQAQTLWDATMAAAVAEALEATPGALVVHVTGAFHVDTGTGSPEALRHYRPGARDLVVVIRSVEEPRELAQEHVGAGDFVVLTRSGAGG